MKIAVVKRKDKHTVITVYCSEDVITYVSYTVEATGICY